MAGHLAKAGLDVTIYNRTFSKADAWVAEHDLRGVPLGAQGAFAGMTEGTTFVDHTTASANVA
jgi:3-hydroxyisobutyrate dehydrogenase-like beta-hydroxyacid dehydrogenase